MDEINNVTCWYNQRQIQNSNVIQFERHLQVNVPFAKRLSVETELKGHSGCVNCIEWNKSGELLASGSDDFNVIVWDMLKRKPLNIIPTQHEGNIFSVKFLPYSNDSYIASSSADSTIRVHCVSSNEQTRCYSCHIRRVKRLCVTNQSPFMLWSGSEDGTVREFDLREPHTCSSSDVCRNVLINLASHVGPSCEVKCIQFHPLYPEYVAVGCADPYLRLYDRRMMLISTAQVKSNLQVLPGCVKYFAPGHLKSRSENRKKYKKDKIYATTYASFSPNGEELVQNLGGEHIYIYDIKKNNSEISSPDDYISVVHNVCATPSFENLVHGKNGVSKNTGATFKHSTYECRKKNKNNETNHISEIVNQLKLKGNDCFSNKNYFQAIYYYNEALKLTPHSSLIYANKAAALLKRAWDGDIYEALKLSNRAVLLDPSHVKAMYRQARCLYELQWYYEANQCIQTFREKFPQQKGSSSFCSLENELKKHIRQDASNGGDSTANDSLSRRGRISHMSLNQGERMRRENALDYKERLVGACNTNTDIKEVNYFGNNGQFIVAGSDCGCVLLWDRKTTNLLEAWKGDESIVNCLQPHPTSCMLATSGIDPVIRVWSPRCEHDEETNSRNKQIETLVRSNQKLMNIDPLEEMLRSMGYQATLSNDSGEDDQDSNDQCRTQ